MKSALRFLLALLTFVSCTTIAGAAVQEAQRGIVIEKACVLERDSHFSADFSAPRTGADDLVSGSRFWSKAEFNGTRVYQRNDLIDAALVDARGRTNLQRMQSGLAPIGPDGKSVNLHHMTQANNSPLAEMTATFHQQNSKVIHINPSSIPSGIDRKAFDAFRRDYWINRATDFSP